MDTTAEHARTGGDARRAPRIETALVTLAVIAGLVYAWSRRWTNDDAYISFRYARNLVRGNGLVFNAGERVEGFTNLLWTLWVALGMRLGCSPEAWAIGWGLAAYAGTIVLLGRWHRELRTRAGVTRFTVPFAALGAALHTDLATFATGGLETSAFTFLALLGAWCAIGRTVVPARSAAAGLVFALASFTRPDGVVFALVIGLALLVAAGRNRPRAVLLYALAFAALWIPVTLWRVRYYGDFFPNTYYAKSADRTWYSQGFIYLRLYLERYHVLVLGPLLAPFVLLFAPRNERAWWRDPLLAVPVASVAACALVYGFYVVRVGGDFMFARLFIPTVPFCLLGLDAAVLRSSRGRAALAVPLGAALLAALWFTPSPLAPGQYIAGITDEWTFYSPDVVASTRANADVIRPYIAGLQSPVVFFGGEARFMDLLDVPVAIEGHAGLTDRHIAHQPLRQRSRVGHEKHATYGYLVRTRHVALTFSPLAEPMLALDRRIPPVLVRFGPLPARLLYWDPALVAQLGARGARVDPFLEQLDRIIAGLDQLPVEQVAVEYARLRTFYFDHVDDPVRRAAFERRLHPAHP